MKKIINFFTIALLAFIVTACSDNKEEKNTAPKIEAPAETVINFFKAIEAGETEKFFSYMDTSNLSEEELSMAKSKLDMMMGLLAEELKNQGGIKEIKILSVTYNDDKTEANVQFETILGNEDKSTETMTVKLLDDQWKLKME